MAVLSLNTNLPSLRTQRRLAESSNSLSKSFERLSSGLRISRASDDAAGLAISSGLMVDSRVFSQALRNLADGASVTNIAEGALDQLTNIVLRLQELAEQAANGTLGVPQRGALDAEAQALSKEYFRIAKTTEFNGRKLLDGSVQGLALQAGYGTEGALQSSLGGKMGQGSFSSTTTFGSGISVMSSALGDLNSDGTLDFVAVDTTTNSASVYLGNGDGTFRAGTDYAVGNWPLHVSLGDLNNDGSLDIVAAAEGQNSVSVLLGNGDGTFKTKTTYSSFYSPFAIDLKDMNADGSLDIISAHADGSLVSVRLGNGDGTFGTRSDWAMGNGASFVEASDLNRDGIPDIVSANWSGSSVSVRLGNGDGTFGSRTDLASEPNPSMVALGDINGDGFIDIFSADYSGATSSVFLGNGNGTFASRRSVTVLNSISFAELADLNGDGKLDLIATSRTGSGSAVLLGNGDGSFSAEVMLNETGSVASAAVGDINRDGVLDIISTEGSSHVFIGDTRDGVSPLLTFSLKTRADAKWALEIMKQKLAQLGQQRGILGANQSRIATTLAKLQVERENYVSANSRITDVDVASESAALVRTQILQQGAAAVLRQANQSPVLALKLLAG